MKMKVFNAALTATLLLGAGLSVLPAQAANGLPWKTIVTGPRPAEPAEGIFMGSYYKESWMLDPDPAMLFEGVKERRNFYVYGVTQQQCHIALINEANANWGTIASDCVQQ